jgi:large subunit ribosomal protein L25
MQEPQLNAKLRDTMGKSGSGRLRRSGDVPCILYGVEKDTVSLSINRKELEKFLTATHAVIELNYENIKQRAVVKEMQYHPVKGDIIHVDFLRVKAGQEISLAVPLKFVGISPGVKMGGVFQELKSELEVTCLPKYLPNEIEVDISTLDIGDAFHVSDLDIEHVTIKSDPTTTLCSIAIPKKIEEEVVEEVEAEEEEEEVEPEVISGKAKREEEEETAEKGKQG